jgi:opacity protein-like surface antigen
MFMPNRIVLCLVMACAVASGQTAKDYIQPSTAEPARGSNVPRSLFFAGAGGGLGIVASGEQSVFNKGLSMIFDNGVLLGTGTADGPPVTPDLGAEVTGVPLGQLGYFRHFGDSDWLCGVKFSYSYLGATNLAAHNLVIPQVGTGTVPNVPSFEGFSVIKSYEVFVDHQLSLVPFVGRSFKNSFVYAGAGPSLSHVGASLNDLVGFATFPKGSLLPGLKDVSGRPQSDEQSQWAFGVAASGGLTYFITPSWFLDVNYTFSHPFPSKFHVQSPYHNEIYSPIVFEGTLIGDYTAKVNTHLITISLNVGF